MIKFGTGGFRAIIGEDYTKENVQKIAQALSKIIKKQKSKKPVIIGYDRRFMSKQFAIWFAEVLAGNKIVTNLYDRPVPTPTVMMGVMQDGTDYGVTITASHNPHTYNGVKITTHGGIDANVEFTTLLENLANKNPKIKSQSYEKAVENNLILTYDNMSKYIKTITSVVSKDIKNNKIKLLFNAMHGVTVEPIKMLAKKFNLAKFDIINEDEDPYFEHKLPSPNEQTLVDFQKQVVKGKYSIGIACDGDGDRIGIIDEQGTYYNCNKIMGILYYYLNKYRNMPGDFVKNSPTSILLDQLAEKFGNTCYSVPVGFKWVSSKMKETGAIMGGESSGGLTIKNYTPCKDSMLAVALVLDAMAVSNKSLSKLLKEVEEFAGYISTYWEDSIKIKSKKKLIKALSKSSPNFPYPPKSIERTDGVKYIFENDSFVQIRFSGTEDLLRYYLEFQTEIECERVLKAINKFIDSNSN